MTDKTNQNKMLLQHMREIGPISRAEAMNVYGIGNITARITDLRHDGHNIQTIITKSKNRYGRKISYARWMLMEKSA